MFWWSILQWVKFARLLGTSGLFLSLLWVCKLYSSPRWSIIIFPICITDRPAPEQIRGFVSVEGIAVIKMLQSKCECTKCKILFKINKAFHKNKIQHCHYTQNSEDATIQRCWCNVQFRNDHLLLSDQNIYFDCNFLKIYFSQISNMDYICSLHRKF